LPVDPDGSKPNHARDGPCVAFAWRRAKNAREIRGEEATQLWIAFRLTQAIKHLASDGGPNGRSPQSPTEIGLIIGTDFSFVQ
jgi:hypothetical protein